MKKVLDSLTYSRTEVVLEVLADLKMPIKGWKTFLKGHFQTYSSNPAFCDILNMFQSGSQQNFKVPLLDGEMLEDVGSRHHPLVRHQGARVVEGNYILTQAFQKIRSEPNKIKILM